VKLPATYCGLMAPSWKKIGAFLPIIVVTLFLLEVTSPLILYLLGTKLTLLQSEFVFEQVHKDGSVVPTKDYVLPVKANANITWSTPEFSVSLRTNNIGLREPFDINYSDIEVAFFGDSFTFGQGVNVEERYTNVFAQSTSKCKKKTASLSYKNGFQPEHYEYFFRNNEDLRPSHVIVGLYLGNDLGSDILETMYESESNVLRLPYRRILEGGQMAIAPGVYRWPLDFLADKSSFAMLFLQVIGRKTLLRSYLFKDGWGPNSPFTPNLELALTDLASNRGVQSLVRLKELIEKRGGQLTILIIPQNYFFGDDNPHIQPQLESKVAEIRSGRNILSAFKEICIRQKFDCFDPSSFLHHQDYFAIDGHWNKSGHGKVGKALVRHLLQSLC